MKKEFIIQNEAKCKKCGDIIWSGSTHDFKSCGCGAISVDGGMSYIKRCGEPEDIEDRSLSTDREKLLECVQLVEKAKEQVLTTPNDTFNYSIAFIVASYYSSNSMGEIFIKRSHMKALVHAVSWGRTNNRNSFGIVLAVIRALRDNDCLDMSKFNQE